MVSQIEAAQRMYDTRASNYEASWHPDYSKRFVSYINVRPGMRVLDLCCGTGLEAFLVADLVGETGEVVCVDISNGSMHLSVRKPSSRTPGLNSLRAKPAPVCTVTYTLSAPSVGRARAHCLGTSQDDAPQTSTEVC
jgi:SAM-dependent methyltransferase